ncbi:MAG: 23S rRNA (guanosine(2251)-2'-O)-methyltransferase RlmB [Oscillospiraceae bacterium]|nr:23S rRNA (guanosine(2251)-2'-O)-methyltransferase RlmB [Oscillospiraceae bacterium]
METTQNFEGRHTVKEALLTGLPIDKLYILKDAHGLSEIRRLARESGIPIVECDRARLNAMAQTEAHQGVIASGAAHDWAELDDIWQKVEQSGLPPLIVVCDGVEDPRNLGAIIRTAECAGAHGVVVPKRRSAGLTGTLAKTAAGALEHIPIVRVPNITALLKDFKTRGLWVYGAECGEEAQSIYETDFSGGVALVMGAEGEGLSRLVKENCDTLVRIPIYGNTQSLNVSTACGVILWTIKTSI